MWAESTVGLLADKMGVMLVAMKVVLMVLMLVG